MSRRAAQRRSKEKVLAPSDGSNANARLVGAVAISTVALILVYVFLPPATAPEPLTQPDSGENQLDASQTPLVSQPLPQEDARLVLPTSQVEFNTEAEQKRLLSEVEKAVKLFPQDEGVLQAAGLTYAELLQTDRAIELFQRSLAVKPANPPLLVSYSKVLMQLGKHEEAVTLLKQAVDRGLETDELLDALGEAYSQAGQIEDAAITFARVIEIAPHYKLAKLHLAQALNQLERFEQSEQQARAAIAQGLTDRAVYVALSTALIRQNKRTEALAIREQMLPFETQVMPDDKKYQESFRGFASHTYAMLGTAYVAHDSLSQAEQLLMRSLELEPDSYRGAVQLADILRREGRLEDALVVFERLVATQPENLVNYHNLASLAISTGNLGLAEKTLRQAANVDASGNADLTLARFLLGTGNLEAGAAQAQIAVDRLGDVDAYLVLIEALRGRGDSVSAFKAYQKARGMAPDDPRLATFQP